MRRVLAQRPALPRLSTSGARNASKAARAPNKDAYRLGHQSSASDNLDRLAHRVIKSADEGQRDPLWSPTPDRNVSFQKRAERAVASTSKCASKPKREEVPSRQEQDMFEDAFKPPVWDPDPNVQALSNMRPGHLILVYE